jgi:hypothetical protein
MLNHQTGGFFVKFVGFLTWSSYRDDLCKS